MRRVRTADNWETLPRLSPLERAEDRLDFATLLAQIWAESGCYRAGILKEIEEAEFVLRRLRNRKAK